ncbi:MAG: hypothetical protein WBA12_05400, partial [Catalinimonas sp.]
MNRRLLPTLLGAAALGAAAFTYRRVRPAFGARAQGDRLLRIERSPQYRDGQFRNASQTRMAPAGRDVPRVLKKFLLDRAGRVPVGRVPRQTPHLPPLSADETDVTWFGHSAALLRTGGLT